MFISWCKSIFTTCTLHCITARCINDPNTCKSSRLRVRSTGYFFAWEIKYSTAFVLFCTSAKPSGELQPNSLYVSSVGWDFKMSFIMPMWPWLAAICSVSIKLRGVSFLCWFSVASVLLKKKSQNYKKITTPVLQIDSLVSHRDLIRVKKAPIVSSGALRGGNGFFIAGSR